jgi:hypothetical protein
MGKYHPCPTVLLHSCCSISLLLPQCVLAVLGVGLGPHCSAAGDDVAAGGPLAAAAAWQVRSMHAQHDRAMLQSSSETVKLVCMS